MILEYNLQFFAKEGPGGEKTEEPTQKKLSDARKDGQVAKSKEIGNCAMLLALFLVLKVYVGGIGIKCMEVFRGIYNKVPELSHNKEGGADGYSIMVLLKQIVTQFFLIVLPVFLVAFVVCFMADFLQVKWKPTKKPLKPKFSKLNPIKGFKKILSIRSVIELLKSFLKIGLIVAVMYTTVKDSVGFVYLLYDMSLMQAVQGIGDIVINLGIKTSAFFIIVAAIDWKYEKHHFHEEMKMTKQEVKDEYKNSEGDPQIKGKIRQKMREVSQRRMMQSVPTADVVITNPTHYAVALKYEPEVQDAPYIVAKGQDFLAYRIKEVARENHVEIVENKPLARMLYHNVEVGGSVPPELFQAVAEVLAMVYSIQGKLPEQRRRA